MLFMESEIREKLETLDGWEISESGTSIEFEHTFETFVEAIAFVNEVSEVAEALNHHPDIGIHYRRVTLSAWSHDLGGVSERDFALAEQINHLL